MITRVTIQEILADQWETMSEQTLIKRRFSWTDELNYCLTGIRRAGKSYMLMQRYGTCWIRESQGMLFYM